MKDSSESHGVWRDEDIAKQGEGKPDSHSARSIQCGGTAGTGRAFFASPQSEEEWQSRHERDGIEESHERHHDPVGGTKAGGCRALTRRPVHIWEETCRTGARCMHGKTSSTKLLIRRVRFDANTNALN